VASRRSLASCLELARLACREARRAGADAAESSAGLGRSVEAELEESRLKGTTRHSGESLSVRAYYRGGRGSFVIHELNQRAAREAARRAAELSRSATGDPDWKRLPSPRKTVEVSGLYDRRLADPRAELVLGAAEQLLATARREAPGCKVSGSVSVVASRAAFANSRGIAHTTRGTSMSAGCLAVVRKGGKHGSFYDFDMGRRLSDVNIPPIGASAARGAMRYLGGRSLPSGEMTVVLGPLAAAALIESVVSAASAESLQRRRSFLAGKLGKRIASKHLTVRDDGLIPGGIYSSGADSEGVPRERLLVIERGMLRCLLHNTYTAGKAGTRSNGHCAGAGCAPSNLRPDLGELTAAEIIADVKQGLYINSASVAPNPSSGDVSAMVDFGLAIENGKLSHPVANVNVGGHVFELLANLDAVSSDYREEPGCLLPTIRIAKAHVSGSA
jgi:PmbA protein